MRLVTELTTAGGLVREDAVGEVGLVATFFLDEEGLVDGLVFFFVDARLGVSNF